MKILIAEDDAVSALLLERTLKRAGYEVTVARNGAEALEALGHQSYDALLTDWMMPSMDGIELTRRVRATVEPQPLIMMVTALSSEEARVHALEAGADDYLAKPVDPKQVVESLNNCMERRQQPLPEKPAPKPLVQPQKAPPMVGVMLTASTGGPTALVRIVRDLPPDANAAYFIVLHGPSWVLETFRATLQRETPLDIRLAKHGDPVERGGVYIAPADVHMSISQDPLRIELRDDAPENFVRPAADPLFRCGSQVFGRFCIAVVLTGMGRDGSLGAAEVAALGGSVLAQDPASAIAPSMPKTVMDLGVTRGVFPLEDLPNAIGVEIANLAERLVPAA